MNQRMDQSMDFFGMDQPMDLLTKTKTDGSQVIRKLSREETRQIEQYKKMGGRKEAICSKTHELLSWMGSCNP